MHAFSPQGLPVAPVGHEGLADAAEDEAEGPAEQAHQEPGQGLAHALPGPPEQGRCEVRRLQREAQQLPPSLQSLQFLQSAAEYCMSANETEKPMRSS